MMTINNSTGIKPSKRLAIGIVVTDDIN